MFKYIFSFLVISLTLVSPSFASHGDAQLQANFGTDLTKAPFFLRFQFSQEYNKDWEKSDYAERKDFLGKYEAGVAAQNAKDKTDAKAARLLARQNLMEQRAESRSERAKLKAEADEEKSETKAEVQRQKEFNHSLTSQDKALEDMQRQATRGGGVSQGALPPPSNQGAAQGSSQDSY